MTVQAAGRHGLPSSRANGPLSTSASAAAPSVDGAEADAPQAPGSFTVAANAAGPQVQMMAGLGFYLLGVFLAQQA